MAILQNRREPSDDDGQPSDTALEGLRAQASKGELNEGELKVELQHAYRHIDFCLAHPARHNPAVHEADMGLFKRRGKYRRIPRMGERRLVLTYHRKYRHENVS